MERNSDFVAQKIKDVPSTVMDNMQRECAVAIYCDQIPDSLPLLVFEVMTKKNALKIYTLLNHVPFIPMVVMGQKGGLGIPPGTPRNFPLASSLLATAIRLDKEFIDAVKLLVPLNKNMNITPHLLDLFDRTGLELPSLDSENCPSWARQFR
jgi:hypothetical protein